MILKNLARLFENNVKSAGIHKKNYLFMQDFIVLI